ncbi:hypothetical protein PCYB_041730 [Plasmodium cynomolgi strain B]|uniref:Uncharacterized protein n=1 Tax=Plasmodium cynomolgi (strain B) TaxID=1120755 RepID=K6UCJ7_PLACD|nr:hypothetical protein PCYB_041730 [Plasmodium cynomolgi strain B]GAB64971.1 hypothetical protein PCYB_041730 [Plasmodium cynomolgi strain B]
MKDQGERGGGKSRRSNGTMRNSNAGKSPSRRDDSNVYNSPLSSRVRNVNAYEDVDITAFQKDGSPGKLSIRCVTNRNEVSPSGVLGSLRKNSFNRNEEVAQRQNIQYLHVEESVRNLHHNNAFNFTCSPTTSMTVSTTTPMYGYSHDHLHILESDDSPMFDDLLLDDARDAEGGYFRLGSPTAGSPRLCFEEVGSPRMCFEEVGSPRLCFEEAANPGRHYPNEHTAHDSHDVSDRTRSNLPSRKEPKGRRRRRILFTSFSKTMSLLCNEVLSKSFQTMVSYVITTSFFICLNLYVSNSCTYEEIGGFGVAVSVITLLNAVVDGVGNSLDYFCSCSIGMANTDLSLLYLNIAYYTFYLFFAKVLFVFFLAKILFLLFLNYLYAGVDSGVDSGIGSSIGSSVGSTIGSSVGVASDHCEHVQMIHVFCSSLQILLVSFFPQFIYESTRRYLILHNYIYPSLFSSFVSFILLNFFCYVFVFSFDMKYVGACLSLLLTNVFNFCCVLYFLRIHLARCVSSPRGAHQLAACPEEVFLSGDHYVEVGEEVSDENSDENSEGDSDDEVDETSGAECEDDTLNGGSGGSHSGPRSKTCEDPQHSLDGADRRIHNLTFLFFHKPPDDNRKRGFIKTTRTNIKNIFFEILSFEFQLFESTYLSLTSVATFVQINNILNLVYYVSNSYGIVLSKLIGIYASSRGGKGMDGQSRRSTEGEMDGQDRRSTESEMDGHNRRGRRSAIDTQNRPGGRLHNCGTEPLRSGGSEWGHHGTQSKEEEHAKGTLPMALHHPKKHTLRELKPRRKRSGSRSRGRGGRGRVVITVLDIVLAFLLMLTFLSFFLAAAYLYRDQIIPFVFTDVNIQQKLKGVIFVFVLELFLEVLASLLNSIIKGLSLQEEISTFTLLNFVFCMHPLGLLLTFILHMDIYGFVYSNLVSMAVQVAYLVVFLALRARGGLGK